MPRRRYPGAGAWRETWRAMERRAVSSPAYLNYQMIRRLWAATQRGDIERSFDLERRGNMVTLTPIESGYDRDLNRFADVLRNAGFDLEEYLSSEHDFPTPPRVGSMPYDEHEERPPSSRLVIDLEARDPDVRVVFPDEY